VCRSTMKNSLNVTKPAPSSAALQKLSCGTMWQQVAGRQVVERSPDRWR
jgi:hypothetical protein